MGHLDNYDFRKFKIFGKVRLGKVSSTEVRLVSRKRTISDFSSQCFAFVSVKNNNNEVSYSGRLQGSI